MATSLLCKLGGRLIFKQPTSQLTKFSSQSYGNKIVKIMKSPFHSFETSYSSALTTITPKEKCQIFINYRGEELGYSFVSHLTEAFQRHNIKFFVDKDEQRGKDLKHLFVRIQESKIGLAIFSQRYSDSRWCMNELMEMKRLVDEGKIVIIPVFYKVEAGDVRRPTIATEFGKNFWKLMESSRKTDPVQEWRQALESISNKMGVSLGEKSSEADFIKVIVKAVERVIESMEEEI